MEYEILEHTADLKIRAYGETLPLLFRNALKGMFASLHPVVAGEKVSHNVDVTSYDRESLLVDFLAQALYLSDVHKEAYVDFVAEEVSDTHVKGFLSGFRIKGFEEGEIKAVTHHDLKLEKRGEMWIAEILFDL